MGGQGPRLFLSLTPAIHCWWWGAGAKKETNPNVNCELQLLRGRRGRARGLMRRTLPAGEKKRLFHQFWGVEVWPQAPVGRALRGLLAHLASKAGLSPGRWQLAARTEGKDPSPGRRGGAPGSAAARSRGLRQVPSPSRKLTWTSIDYSNTLSSPLPRQ